MKINLNKEDISILNKSEDYDIQTLEDIEKQEKEIIDDINYWNGLKSINIREVNLGFYYSGYLLTRDILQFYIENTSQETSDNIINFIKDTDEFFKSKMSSKPHYYDHHTDLKENYFWHKFTIHPIDSSKNLEKEKSHPNSLKILYNDYFFWQDGCFICPFGDRYGKTSLLEFRTWRVYEARTSIVKCFDWIFECFETEKAKYLNFLDKDTTASKKYSFRQTILDRTILSTTFAQFADEGKIDEEAIPICKVAIERLKYYTEINMSKISYKIKFLFISKNKTKEALYLKNLSRLDEILNTL